MTGLSDGRLRMERLCGATGSGEPNARLVSVGHRMGLCEVSVDHSHRDSVKFLTCDRDFLL